MPLFCISVLKLIKYILFSISVLVYVIQLSHLGFFRGRLNQVHEFMVQLLRLFIHPL